MQLWKRCTFAGLQPAGILILLAKHVVRRCFGMWSPQLGTDSISSLGIGYLPHPCSSNPVVISNNRSCKIFSAAPQVYWRLANFSAESVLLPDYTVGPPQSSEVMTYRQILR